MQTYAQKKALEKYLNSPKGRAARKRAQDRYNHSRRGRAARQRYLATAKGKEAVEKYKRIKALMR